MMLKRIIIGVVLVLVVTVGAVIVLHPVVVDTAVSQYDRFSKYDLSLYDVISPQIQNRKHIVRVNNTRVVAIEETELSFPVSGIIAEVFVKEGETLQKGQRIASLNTKELNLDRANAIQSLVRAQSSLSKLKSGTRKEDITLYESKVNLASTSVRVARESLLRIISSGYTTMDDALESKFQSIVSVGHGSDPVLMPFIADDSKKEAILSSRKALDPLMDAWKIDIATANVDGDVSLNATLALKTVQTLRDFFDTVALALNSFQTDGASSLSARTLVGSLRGGADTVITQITDARAVLNSAEDAYLVAKNELALKSAGSELTDIHSAESSVQESRNALSVIEEKLAKSTLVAPLDDMIVKKIYIKSKEVVQSGQTVALLAVHGYKFEADVPEEDIGFVSQGDLASVILRSYRDRKIDGEVFSINEQEIIKNEDTYFRVNIMPSSVLKDIALRTGMTGEASIVTDKNKEVYTLPLSAVRQEGAIKSILVKDGNDIHEVRVTIGAEENGVVEIIGPISSSTVVLVSK